MAEFGPALQMSLSRTVRRRLRRFAETTATRAGWRLTRLSASERRYLQPSHADSPPLPADVAEQLRADHPALQTLRQRYATLDLPVTKPSLWRESLLSTDLDLRYFRGDNPYVWQFRNLQGQAELKYFLYLLHVQSRDDLGLLERLHEDGAFGCWTFDYHRHSSVSRDLLDSVNELNYLDRQLGISQSAGLQIIDIGAGYGRLAHRACEGLPNLQTYFCVDAIAESTFLCDFYLRFRNCEDRAHAIALDEMDQRIPQEGLDLAVNIHSFTECTLAAIQWWLRWLAARKVPHLLIVPNEPRQLLSMEIDGSRLDFEPLLAAAGYELVHREPVINDPDVRHLFGVSDHYHLYRLQSPDS